MDHYLQDFVESHPQGWSHDEWLGLLTDLSEKGVNVDDTDAIGFALENERLAWELRRREVPGLGPKRIDAVVSHFGTLWNLRHAEVDEIAQIKTIPGKLAEKVVEAMR